MSKIEFGEPVKNLILILLKKTILMLLLIVFTVVGCGNVIEHPPDLQDAAVDSATIDVLPIDAMIDTPSAATAQLDLGTIAPQLAGLIIRARVAGDAGNSLTVALTGDGPPGVYFQEHPVGKLVIFYGGGENTIGDFAFAISSSPDDNYPSYRFAGGLTGNPNTLLSNTFPDTHLSGGL